MGYEGKLNGDDPAKLPRLGWTILFKALYFFNLSLKLVPSLRKYEKRSISNHIKLFTWLLSVNKNIFFFFRKRQIRDTANQQPRRQGISNKL